MPIMVFDRHGNFLRAWGQGMFKLTHFLRVDRFGYIWVTDRRPHAGDIQIQTHNGKLILTLGKQDITAATTPRTTPSTAWPTSP